jgi:hypothetical protein
MTAPLPARPYVLTGSVCGRHHIAGFPAVPRSPRQTSTESNLMVHPEPAMPIWKPRPTSEMPRIPLSRWRILETEDGSRHFVGVDMFDRSGRVSSPIVDFDPVAMEGKTETGRIYELIGRNGSSLDVDYVWTRWCELYEVKSYTDVTERLLTGANNDNAI